MDILLHSRLPSSAKRVGEHDIFVKMNCARCHKDMKGEQKRWRERDRISGFKIHSFPLPRAVAPELNCELSSCVDSARAQRGHCTHVDVSDAVWEEQQQPNS